MGRELAIHLCQLGVNVACVDINVENCYGTILQASRGLGVAKAYICDITEKNEVSIIFGKLMFTKLNRCHIDLIANEI